MSLEQLERQFWNLMRQPLDAVDKYDASVIFRSRRISAEKSVDIYRRMYWFRQQEAMAEGFSRVLLAMGNQSFAQVVRRYLEKFPSCFPELERLGNRFAEFLREEGCSPLLADLAKLEWSRTLAFLTPEVPVASLTNAALNPNFSSLKLEFVPSFQMLRLHPLTFEYWQHPDKVPVTEEQSFIRRPLVVSRHGFSVSHEWVDDVEALALEAAIKGADINQLCTLFVQNDQSPEKAMKWVSRWFFRRWVRSTAP